MKYAVFIALVNESFARRHHHHHHRHALVDTKDMESLEAMSTNKLVEGLRSTLSSALSAEARDDKASAVAKTAAIKNIQKALTARILKRLDDGQPLVEVARKMKAIEGMQPQINDMERRLGIMQSVEPVLENAIKTLQKVVDVRGMGKASLLQINGSDDKSIAWREVDPLVKSWKVGDKPLTKNQLEKLSREDEEAYHNKQTDYMPGQNPDPKALEGAEEAAEAGAAMAKAEKDGARIAGKANEEANKNKGNASKEMEKKAKTDEKNKELGLKKEEEKDLEKERMAKKEEKVGAKEEKKEEKKEDKEDAKEEKKEEEKKALLQINGYQPDESSYSDSDDE